MDDEFGMSGNELDKFINKQPVFVFARLARSNPENVVYSKCLDDEVNDMANSILSSYNDFEIASFDICRMAMNELASNINSDEIDDDDDVADMLLKVNVMNMIFKIIYRKKGIEMQ